MKRKTCFSCKQILCLSEFYESRTRGGHMRKCKACATRSATLWRKENRSNVDEDRDGIYAATLDEIAAVIGVTPQRVSQIIHQALAKVSASTALRDFVGAA